MKNTWTLTKMRMRLALRTRIFLFFSLIMPLAFLFLYAVVFARSEPRAVAYMMPAVLALTVMGSFWGLSMQLVSFREQGILRRFRLAPVGPGAMLASGVLSNYFLTLPTLALEFLIAWWFFGVKDWGNVAGALVLVSLGAMAFATLGLIVASVANTMQETQAICNAVWFPLLFFSGATLPLPLLPGWLQNLALFLPSTYLVTGLQRMIVEDAPVFSVGGDLLALGGCLVTCFLMATQTFRWEAEQKIVGRAKLRAAAAIIPFLLIGGWENAYGHRLTEANATFQELRARAAPQPEKAGSTVQPQAASGADGDSAPAIRYLPPSSFPQLPPELRLELETRGCSIPQTFADPKPHNVVSGAFTAKDSRDWAVLCSRGGVSSILVWNEESLNVMELAPGRDADSVQGVGGDRMEYSRLISAADRATILKHAADYGGPAPPPLGHQAIDDAFLEKASVVHYFHRGMWLRLQGAD